ncbi:MAG: tRNA (guanosine(46)-N7)-methyltransferase TrmB [Pseudomonadota bacterium]
MRRAIHSYVRREGHFTRGQRRAFEQYFEQFDWFAQPPAPGIKLHAEIGTGNGDNLSEMAQRFPWRSFIACEVHRPGVGALLNKLTAAQLTNVRIANTDAWQLLETLPQESLASCMVLFPDPWPKKRHHKRRLLNAEFVDALSRVLCPGGRVCVATDNEDYASQICRTFDQSAVWINGGGHGRFSIRLKHRLQTRYEARATRLGHKVFNCAFIRAAWR